MRLTPTERNAIVDCVRKRDQNAKVFLYGSRVHNYLRGGDIDLLVQSEILDFSDKISLLVEIKDQIGEQKIDLSVVNEDQMRTDPFYKVALKEAVLLNS